MRALIVPIAVVVAALASAGPLQQSPRVDPGFREATRGFLAALRPESRQRASFAFDDPLRFDWHFVPRERKGLPLGAMNNEERRAAHVLLRKFLTPRGYGRALGVMELEGVLREIEHNPGRDPGGYFFSVFGDPQRDDGWSLRIEGHHLALNFTGMGADGIAPTPLFLGANPAEVQDGPRAGFKLLAPHEELARELVKSLSPKQRAQAVIAASAPADVLFGPGKAADPMVNEGLPTRELAPEQLRLVERLFAELQGDVALPAPADRATTTRFVWAGGMEPGQGHYWRLAADDAVFEYDNTQNGANHVHFLWRDPKNDFAAAWLARHHASEHARNDDERGGRK